MARDTQRGPSSRISTEFSCGVSSSEVCEEATAGEREDEEDEEVGPAVMADVVGRVPAAEVVLVGLFLGRGPDPATLALPFRPLFRRLEKCCQRGEEETGQGEIKATFIKLSRISGIFCYFD